MGGRGCLASPRNKGIKGSESAEGSISAFGEGQETAWNQFCRGRSLIGNGQGGLGGEQKEGERRGQHKITVRQSPPAILILKAFSCLQGP